jgi:MFS family permease
MNTRPSESQKVGLSAFIVVVTAGWTINLTFTLIAPILPQIASVDGSNAGELAAELVMTIASLGVMLGMLTSGAIQDWLGTRKVILFSLLWVGIAGSAGFFIHNLLLLGISRALLGFFGACSTAALTVLLASLFDETSRGRVLGYQQAIAGGFNVCGSLIGGWINTLLGWRYVFLVYGVLALAAFILASVGASDVASTHDTARGSLIGAVARSWRLLAVGIGVLTLTIVPYTQGSFILAKVGVTDSRIVAVIIAGSAVLLIVGAGLYSRFRMRMAGASIILLGAALASVGVITIGLAPGAPVVAVGIAMTGFAGGLVITALLHRATEGEEHLRARAIGLVHACLYLGVLSNPMIIGFLRARLELNQAVALWGTVALITTIVVTIAWRERTRRHPAAI